METRPHPFTRSKLVMAPQNALTPQPRLLLSPIGARARGGADWAGAAAFQRAVAAPPGDDDRDDGSILGGLAVNWLVHHAGGGGSGSSPAKRRRTFSVSRDTLLM